MIALGFAVYSCLLIKMICPSCGHLNLPGSDECAQCNFDLTALDRPIPLDRVEASVMSDPVYRLKPRKPILVPVTASLGHAIQKMVDAEAGAVLVVNNTDGKLLGILTERDFLTKLVGMVPNFAHETVEAYMTPAPETVAPTDSLAQALYKMDVGGYRHVPVVENGIPIGLLSVREVIQHITQLCEDK